MKHILSTTAMVLALAACGGDVAGDLGLRKQAPDEFNVVSRPPLSVPPDFYLPPPSPGAPPRFDSSQEEKARGMVFGEGKDVIVDTQSEDGLEALPADAPETAVMPLTLSDGLPSTQESSLLSRLGVDERDPEIRVTLYKESLAPAPVKEEATALEQWLGMDEQEPLIDPAAEAERIRAAKDAGEPLAGEVKTINQKNQSVLDQLFD